MTSPYRYPGAKGRLIGQILPHILQGDFSSFGDLFVGGGSVAIAVAERSAVPITLNDLDPGIAAFWRVVVHGDLDLFLSRIYAAKPTVEEFRHLLDSTYDDDVSRAYQSFFLNRCSFSGTGKWAIGGWKQEGKWKIDFAWNPSRTERILDKCRTLFQGRTKVYERDALRVPWPDRVYLDPPYYKVGSRFYGRQMSEAQHSKLAQYLVPRSGWVLSYDDCTEVRDLYTGARIHQLNPSYYSITGAGSARTTARNCQRPELLITKEEE